MDKRRLLAGTLFVLFALGLTAYGIWGGAGEWREKFGDSELARITGDYTKRGLSPRSQDLSADLLEFYRRTQGRIRDYACLVTSTYMPDDAQGALELECGNFSLEVYYVEQGFGMLEGWEQQYDPEVRKLRKGDEIFVSGTLYAPGEHILLFTGEDAKRPGFYLVHLTYRR